MGAFRVPENAVTHLIVKKNNIMDLFFNRSMF